MNVFKFDGRKFIAGLGILALMAASVGCSQSEKLTWERLKQTHFRLVTGKTLKKNNQPVGQASSANAIVDKQGNSDKTAVKQEKPKQKVKVTLYFADQSGDYLVAEKREIALVPGLAKATIQELIEGPKTKGLNRTIPEGSKLLGINVENGLCTVNFNKQFKTNHWGGSTGEILTVYSLVDTLTQFDKINKVEILVNGQKLDTLAGHMDLTAPVTRNSQIIKS